MEKNKTVYSSDTKFKGLTTGSEFPCRMEGCRGMRIGVRWNDGTITFPCTKGLTEVNGKLKIMG